MISKSCVDIPCSNNTPRKPGDSQVRADALEEPGRLLWPQRTHQGQQADILHQRNPDIAGQIDTPWAQGRHPRSG